jgi:hypothetical protein
VTLNHLAAELKILDRYVHGLSLAAIQRRIWNHIKKHGIAQRRVTHMAQHTRYEQIFIQGWVSHVNQSINFGNYKECDVINIDETSVNFDLASRMMIDGRGERII